MPNHKLNFRTPGLLILLWVMLGVSFDANAFAPEFYATTSRLSSGQWAKIEVKETGIQFISDASLRTLGFSDPSAVNIYGYGGVMIPDNLDSPDDLPMVASLRVNGGIIFFGKASVGWNQNPSGLAQYSHQNHAYSDNAFYFVSDCVPERKDPVRGQNLVAAGETITSFTERLVHEQDLFMPMTSGRLILGEDFRTSHTRSFRFELPGNIGDAIMTTAFGCKTSSGTSSILFNVNGRQLPSTGDDQMSYSSSKHIVTTKSVKEITDPGTLLDLTIKFNGSGTVTSAGLDYIEIEYPRALEMNGSDLYFYIKPETASEVEIRGASGSTIVWDVTDPQTPVQMSVANKGNLLTFVSPEGYHEYVAFDPPRISRAAQPSVKISNQDLHAMPAPGLLIISPQEYLSAAQRLVNIHQRTDGLSVAVVTPEEVYNEFSSGKPDVSAFRKLLKMWYDRAGGVEGEYTSYCLIMSRPTFDNKAVSNAVKSAGYPRVPIWQSPTGETETTSYSTDDFIGMLKDVTGNFNIGTAEINVAVGRMPVKSLSEANTVIDKLEKYLFDTDYSGWRNNIMIIADDQDNGVHLDQAESVVEALRGSGKGNDYIYEKLYLDSYPLEFTGTGAEYPQAHARLMNKWNEGLALIDYIGHANPRSWGHESLFTWTQINSMKNERLPFIYAATCEFMRWDADDVSGAEVLWLLPNSGAISLICPSREVLISANGVLNKSTAQYVFMEDEEGRTLPMGEVMRRGKNSSNTGTNKLRYGLIGDPSMRINWPSFNVKVTEINGVDPYTADELPVLSARSNVTVKGQIQDREGNVMNDFNGLAEITLFDAEKAITTNGNGSEGVQSVYNDRKTRLFAGRTKVNNGEWTTTFTMPSEIENNYSPALISLYAYDETGREANGSCEKLYAYGYDENAPDDFEGPKIIEFYLNSPNFVNGSQVGPNPVLTAKFRDDSGISVSEAGIGHNITLELDGKTYYDDVAQYYIPDENDSGAGSLTYSLGDVGQGNHTLKFVVWDNANNSSTATLDFSISALWKPTIETLTTDVNPATASVNFIIATDGATSAMDCSIEVYDIWGRKVWGDKAPSISGASLKTTLGWDLCNYGGARIPGGVYLYRATVKTDSGATVTKTRKLIVKGQ